MKLKQISSLIVALAVQTFVVGIVAADPSYIVIDLGTLPGGGYSIGQGINNSGQVTGDAGQTTDTAHAFLYSGGSMNDLGAQSAGKGINNSGQIAGVFDITGGASHAFLYSGGSMSDLGTLGGDNSFGVGINNSGQVTGVSDITGGGHQVAFVYSGGTMHDLNDLVPAGNMAGFNFLVAGYAINDSGKITGSAVRSVDSASHAFLFSGGSVTDLGTLGGNNSLGAGINNSGQVTGYSTFSENSADDHAFLYSGGSMSDLGTLGGAQSYGVGINNSEQVTGVSDITGGASHAFLYSGGTMYDLNDLVAAGNMASFSFLAVGYAINDYGWITGYGVIDPDGATHAFLAKPISQLPGPAINISTRLNVGTGDNVMIGGFIIRGNEPKKVILRGIGPSLTAFGVQGALADPVLELHDGSGTIIATNDNWKDTQQADIQASGRAPSDDLESAIIATLVPGSYTAIVSGKNNTTGVGLVEGYDLQTSSDSILFNISTRGFVGIDDNVMIGGFVIGNNGGSANILVRAIGPSLTNFGVANAMQDPTLELHDGSGAIIASNDNWKDTQQTEIQATGLAPTDDAESAILASLAPGSYTAIVRGKNSTTGVALVEGYHLP